MKIITCQNMQRLLVLSSVFLVVGLVLFALFLLLGGPSGDSHGNGALYLAFGFILASPLTLVVNLLLSVLPGSRQALRHCSH
jgi:hypothetical protein